MKQPAAQLVHSPRERAPQVVATARQLAERLNAAGRGVDAGWLLLAMVSSELVRPDVLAAPARALARDAAEQLAASDELVAAVEVYLALGERNRALALLQRGGKEALAESIRKSEESPKVLVQRGIGGRPEIASVARIRERAAQALATEAASSVTPERLLLLCTVLGLDEQAARLAGSLGQHQQAAEAWARLGEGIEAAKHYHHVGASQQALEALVSTEPTHPRYRQACVFAIRLAVLLDQLDYGLFHLVREFLSSGPRSPTEAQAIEQLADLFTGAGQPAQANDLRALARGEKSDEVQLDLGGELPALPSLPPAPDPDTVEREVPVASPHEPTKLPQFEDASTPGRSKRRRTDRDTQNRQESTAAMIGTVVGGRYYIEEQLGRGGYGVVYRARDLQRSEQVALKFLRGVGHDVTDIKRFKQEVSLARRLAHPNIVRVLGLGEEMGTLFISMELLYGVSLRHMPRADLTLPRVLDAISQAAEGLTVAHEMGIVHRDVTLDNLFQTQHGRLKVMDFGLARAVDMDSFTMPGVIAGTPTYLSPEQIRSFSSVTPASDQYSLGVATYILLTGRPPFTHPEILPLLRMHTEAPVVPPSSLAPGLGRRLDGVIEKVLAKRSADRFASCREFAAALREAAADVHPA